MLMVSSLLTNYGGICDVCLSAPSILNRLGVEEPLDMPMNEAEMAKSGRSGVKGDSVAGVFTQGPFSR
jgi:L-lactate dehydrogenase